VAGEVDTLISRDDCLALDAADELSGVRDEFILDEALIYLDGNSLGPVSKGARAKVNDVIDEQWAKGLVRGWGEGWMDAPTRLGNRLATLIGARQDEVLVSDSLTIVLAKLIGGALELRPDRHVILTDVANFRTDIYIAKAMASRAGRPIILKAIERSTLDHELNDDVALVMLTHVDFRSGEMLDMDAITKKVHDVGALMLWDLAHSTGAVPLDVTGADVDFAAGCGYKYLNGGPGAPAFLYVRTSWQGILENPLPGWHGHARPFDFDLDYEAAKGMQAFATSSPPIVAFAALDGALDIWDHVSIQQVRAKSLAMTDLFMNLVQERLGGLFEVVTPKDHHKRASQVALRHAEAYGIIQVLIERNVIGDFRAPDICRFGFTPLYLRFVDVYDAVEHLVAVMNGGLYQDVRFSERKMVT
jgi:kynureninase